MNRMQEMFKKEKMEAGIEDIIFHIQKSPYQINMFMNPIFIACSEIEKTISLEFPVQEWQLNPFGKMHGGLIATAIDEALGIFAGYLNRGQPVVSANIAINYIRPIPMTDSILITAKATSVGRKLITISGECHLKSNGSLTNTAIETFAIV